MEVLACQKYVRVSPFKLRRLAAPLKGMNVQEAESMLKYSPSPSSKWLSRAIHSAASNLKNKLGADAPSDDNLWISKIMINQGPVMRRLKMRAMGRADIIRKRSSHITIMVKGE